MPESIEPLSFIATTDLAAITRGRSVSEGRLAKVARNGVGWVPANLSLTALGGIADPNPWGSAGDLRIVPDMAARHRSSLTGSATPFDMIMGDIVELDGQPWLGCTRNLLKEALSDLKAETGLAIIATFEQEFQLLDTDLPAAHPFSLTAIRRTDPFAPRLMAALQEAGVEPEMVIAEYGQDQFEITHAPAGALAAADRAIVIREMTREMARLLGWRASFAPKTTPAAVGNGVHIHFSLVSAKGLPVSYDANGPGKMSAQMSGFCAGVLRHMRALTAFSAASPTSYLRLRPHNWSSSYTWLGERDREASLRICPIVSIGGDAARQFNIEYRPADATANPYLALAAIIRAGLEGLRAKLPAPPIVAGDPSQMGDAERQALGLYRLPESLPAAIVALQSDRVVANWFHPAFIETYVGVKTFEHAQVGEREPLAQCEIYRALY